MKELKPGDLAMWYIEDEVLPVTILEIEGPEGHFGQIEGLEEHARVAQVLVEGQLDVVYLAALAPWVDGDDE